jgi:hypothetical protein
MRGRSFNVAVSILAAGTGTLTERLKDAHVSSRILMDEISPQGRSDVALAMWLEEDLRRLAEGVVSLYDAIARRMGALGR